MWLSIEQVLVLVACVVGAGWTSYHIGFQKGVSSFDCHLHGYHGRVFEEENGSAVGTKYNGQGQQQGLLVLWKRN